MLLRAFLSGAVVCAAFALFAVYPYQVVSMDAGLMILISTTGIVVGGLIAAVSFTLLCIDFCFRQSRSMTELKESPSLWARLAGAVFWFSEWYACWVLLCLLIVCGGLGLSLGVIIVPTYVRMFF